MVSRNTRSTSSAARSPLPAQPQPSTPGRLALSPNPEAPDGSSGFLYRLFDVLEDATLKARIHWHQDEGLFIPNVDGFVHDVLPVYFPGMGGGWKSFQKQMSNYGFKKRDRNADRAHYVHWDNKFRKGSPELLPYVQRQPKESTSTSQNTIQEQPVAPSTPAVLQPLGQPNLDDEVETLKKQLETKDNEIAELKGRLEVVEAQVLKDNEIAEFKGRLEVVEAQVLKVPELERQISSRLDTTLAQFWGVLCQMVPKMIWDTTDLALRTLLGLQIPNNATSSTPHHSAGMSLVPAPPSMQGGLTNDAGSSSIPGSGQQQNADPSAGAQTSPNGFVSASTSQGRVRTQSSNSLMTSGPMPTVSRVPQPPAPGPRARCRPSGPTNSGHY